ncbi:uncharacterized protein ARMOST_00278 [Armillaria ostoyae]|uniref:Uncharacterized protein n=1 Tax=Armillaria ostoyae TaxID=47428 RepID=A0A284QKN0_ARMOS|nr:uncharacterized protein ARMOST_00278 [Armillaria ostoyae]
MLEHIFNLYCRAEKPNPFGGDVYKAVGGSVMLESSLSEEVLSQVFQGLDRFILDELCVRLAYDISDVLEQVGKEVVLVAFLDWVIDESAHVLDKIPDSSLIAFVVLGTLYRRNAINASEVSGFS